MNKSFLRSLIRIGVIIFYVLILIIGTFLILQGNGQDNGNGQNTLGVIYAFFTLLLSILTAPPLSAWMEGAFSPTQMGEQEVRQYLKEYWIEDFLHAETQLGHELPDGVDSPQLFIRLRLDHSDVLDKRIIHYSVDNLFKDISHSVVNREDSIGERIVIKGESGSGKTIQLLMLADYLLESRDVRVPVFLNLFSWVAQGRKLETWLIDAVSSQYDIERWKARRLIQLNYLVLLLDGFNQIDWQYQRHFMDALTQFLNERARNNQSTRSQLRDAIVISALEVDIQQGACKDDKDYSPKCVEDRSYRQHLHELQKRLQPVTVVTVQKITRRSLEPYLGTLVRYGSISSILRDKVLADSQLETIVSNPFMLRAITTTYTTESRLRLNFDFRNPDEEIIRMMVIEKGKKVADVRSELPYNEDIKQQYLETLILRDFTDYRLRRLPENVSPSIRSIERSRLLSWVGEAMEKQHQPIIRERDALFYLEHVGIQQLEHLRQGDGKQKIDDLKRYKSLVSFVTSLIFLSTFLIFYFLFTYTNTQLIGDISIPNLMRENLLWIGGILSFVFGRIYGWLSCGNLKEARNILTYRVRWHYDIGLLSGLFLGTIVGFVFYEVSCNLYGSIGMSCLTYESLVYSIFTVAIFSLIGGADIGRPYRIVTQPNEGRNFLIVTLLITIIFWCFFFFFFILWPRIQTHTLIQSEIRQFVRAALPYSLLAGAYLGTISGFVFAHLLIRHYVLHLYLSVIENVYTGYSTVLNHCVDIGIMRKLGGGYFFRHSRLRRHIINDQKTKDVKQIVKVETQPASDEQQHPSSEFQSV